MICRRPLVEAGSCGDDDSVVGEECRIISASKQGPRFDRTLPVAQADKDANLILLCPSHHKQVDDQTQQYTADTLRILKAQHEAWVVSTLSKPSGLPPVRITRVKEQEPAHLVRLTSGREVFAAIDGACASEFDHDDLDSVDEVDLVAGFFQTLQDYADLSGSLEARARVEAAYHLGERLDQLHEAGFWVFAGRDVRRVEGGVGGPAPLPIAVVRVIRDDNPEIMKFNLGETSGHDT